MNRPDPAFKVRTANQRLKPLIGVSALERLLLRQVSLLCPESRLCVSVIKQTLIDLCDASPSNRREAGRIFEDGRLEAWCEPIGLNPDFLRELAQKAGYLPGNYGNSV